MNHQKNTGGDIFTLRGKSLSIKKFFLAGLWVLSILFLGGCATTSGSGAAKAGGITVCLNGRCAPADRQDKEQLIGGLLSMLKANENSRGEICSLR